MAKHRDLCGLLRNPVRPDDLFRKLACALGSHDPSVADSPLEIIRQPFPSVEAENFRDLYLLKEVLRKYPDWDIGVDTKQAALISFLEDEQLNAKTNERLHHYNGENPRVSQILDLAARKAVMVLGDFRWDWWLEGCRFGPGATTRLSASSASVARKLSGIPHCTFAASALARELLSLNPHWAWRISPGRETELALELCECDRYEVVPKNAETGRGIGIGPCMNILMQLGMGYSMRRKMARWGINLNDQSINQERARIGSLTGMLATLDLKGASQSVTQALVWKELGNHSHDFCDPTWYRMLDALRTEYALIDGKPHKYELFSAMGNGYTFELESLIFWTLAQATCEFLGVPADVTVYGDDLIVPVETVPLLIEVLGWCGFRLNEKKSFWSTSADGHIFRESCGKHYLDGTDVTPFYVDTPLERVDQVVLLANNLLRWATNVEAGYRDGRIAPVYYWVLSHLPEAARKSCIPFGHSDDGLIKGFDEACPSLAFLRNEDKTSKTFIGYRARTLAFGHREAILDGEDGYVSRLYHMAVKKFALPDKKAWYEREAAKPIKVAKSRKKSLVYKTRVVSSWPNLGPWVLADGCWDMNPSDIAVAVSLCAATSSTTLPPLE